MAALNSTAPGGLPPLTMKGLKAAVLAADPGCLLDPELFTGPDGIEPEDEPVLDRAARVDAARAVCAECPARLACLAYALRTRAAAGVWAGLTPDEITFVGDSARLPVARPRKNARLRTAPVPARAIRQPRARPDTLPPVAA
jgi:hypothetical protein